MRRELSRGHSVWVRGNGVGGCDVGRRRRPGAVIVVNAMLRNMSILGLYVGGGSRCAAEAIIP